MTVLVLKFHYVVYEKCIIKKKKGQNYETNRILWKIKQILCRMS